MDNDARKDSVREMGRILAYLEKEDISLLSAPTSGGLSRGERLANFVSRFAGSWAFIVSMMAFIAIWCVSNIHWIEVHIPWIKNFDPYPFVFLNLILASVAAFQAPMILMAERAAARRDQMREDHQTEVAVIAEGEMRVLGQKVEDIQTKLAIVFEEFDFSQSMDRKNVTEVLEQQGRILSHVYDMQEQLDKLTESVTLLNRYVESIKDVSKP